MPTQTELLRSLRIFNPYDAATFASRRGGAGVYIAYRPQQTGRAYQPAAWQVIRPGFRTDPDSHWRDGLNKTFVVFEPRPGSHMSDKELQRAAAEEWASDRYKVAGWVKIPGVPGALFPDQDAAIIKAAVREARKAGALRQGLEGSS